MTLSFEPKGHVYRWNGQVVPSVTQVLHQWIRLEWSGVYVNTLSGATVDAVIFEAAGKVGKDIHIGAAYLLRGQGLDWDALSPDLVSPLKQCEVWVKLFSVKSLHVEEPMYSERLVVAGTPDLICTLNGDAKTIALVDIKTGLANDMVGAQTSGYEMIAREAKTIRKIIKRYSLVLPRDGSAYKFKPLDGYVDDATYFMACLTRHNYLRKRGLI